MTTLTTPGTAESRIDRWIAYVVAVLIALPVLLFPYPPATDLPYHELEVGILRHFGDRQMFPEGLYITNFGHPNQLFHVASLALAYVAPTHVACRIVLGIAIAGIVIAASRVADHLCVSRWAALLVAPLGIGWLLFFGLVANIVGLGLFLAFLPTVDRFVERPTWRGVVRVCGAFLLLYFGHEAMMFAEVGVFVAFTLLRSWDGWRALGQRLAPIVFAVTLTLAQLEVQRHYVVPQDMKRTVFIPLGLKLAGTPSIIFSNYDGALAQVLFAILVLAVLGFVAQRWRARAEGESRSLRMRLRAHRFELVALALVVVYAFAPSTLNGATFVYHRFLAPAVALSVLALAPRNGERPYRAVRLLCAALPIATSVTLLPAYPESSRAFTDLQALFPLMEKGSPFLLMNAGPEQHGYAVSPIAARAVTERGGRILFSFVESPIAIVRLNPRYNWMEPILRIEGDERQVCPEWDFTRFKYLLLRSPGAGDAALVTAGLSPEAELVDTRGEWMLLRSRLAVRPIATPDIAPPPSCRTDTLASRMKTIMGVGTSAR